jgi:hypothetical protein
LSPGAWENLANIDSVVVSLPVLETDPEVAIQLKRVIKTLLETLIVIPSFIFICKWTVPNALALTPRVPHVN